jgi:hypothetical protein
MPSSAPEDQPLSPNAPFPQVIEQFRSREDRRMLDAFYGSRGMWRSRLPARRSEGGYESPLLNRLLATCGVVSSGVR